MPGIIMLGILFPEGQMRQTTAALSLRDLLYGFVQLTREVHPSATFPIWYSRVWHRFFYDLKRRLGPDFPELLDTIGFTEWDAPDPFNPGLRDLLQSASSSQTLWENESGRTYPTRQLKHDLPQSLFKRMAEIAQEHEGLLTNTGN